MKKVGIIFAMKEEMDALKEYLNITCEYEFYDLKFYEGNINSVTCVLVECGVGKVNAARTTQVLIDKMNVDYVFNIGVAGGISKELNVLDIVIGEKLVQHDFDITAFNHEKGYIPNIGVYIESEPKLVALARKTNIENVKVGNIASGDIFCTLESMSIKINNKFNALAVEMEGASVAQVCYLCKVPFLVIRSISDIPGNNNVISYEEFLIKSSKKVADLMNEILIKL